MLDTPEPLRAIADQLQAARAAADGAAIAALYSEDALVIPPGGQRLAGRAQIAAFYSALPKTRTRAPSPATKWYFFPPLAHAHAVVNGRHGEKHALVDIYAQQKDGAYQLVFSSWTLR